MEAHTLGRGEAQFGHHQFHDANARVRINADFFDARKRSPGLRIVNALALTEILAPSTPPHDAESLPDPGSEVELRLPLTIQRSRSSRS